MGTAMDQKVLEAQQWVNATYGAVPGFKRAPEDGRTGWPTMYALTHALQHELGITPLSDAFGPETLARIDSRGGIRFDEPNKNIIKIIQSACYCKGYDPGGISGEFGDDTKLALASLTGDAGLGGTINGGVPAKIMKALLTMDAYVVVAGGTEAVRWAQRWLNGRYLNRKNFFVIPCDGIFSRDVQKALYFAIQFELGMSDEEANGVFGPATREGLRERTVAEGAKGVFVHIFTASMVFNRVKLSGGASFEKFTDTFDSEVAAAVRNFQEFSALPVNGRGDFTTWCQLLVSTGDPDRPGGACDSVTAITDARAQALLAAGYQVVGRYLENVPGGRNKEIQPGELETIFRNGMKVFPISQYDGGDVAYFDYSRGYQDALKAHSAAVRHGFNAGTVIYFAVDYDATQAEIDSNIVPYFNGVVAGLAANGKKYVHGVYGSRNVCAQVTTNTYARWAFVSGMSTGFSGNMGYPLPENWSFNQIQTLTVGSGEGTIELDKNVYKPGTDPAVSSVNDPNTPADEFVAYIGRLHELAVAYGGDRNPSQRVLEFLRHEDYDTYQWRQLIGEIDYGFVDHVKAAGVQMIREVRDPFYGIDLHVSHFGASCNGLVVHGQDSGTSTNRGDVADWGGDLMTFYGEWRRDSDSYSSGYTYCQERMAKVDQDSTFKLRDLIEDADAYNIAMNVRGGGNIADAVDANFRGGGHLSRFRRFYDGRFGDAANAKAIAADMLLSGDDAIIDLGRTYLIQSTGGVPTLMPGDLPTFKLDEFCQGFADVLLARVGLENG